METLAERYIMLESLLFKLMTSSKRETALLAISETCADKIISLHHWSIFAGYQDVIKTYWTIGEKFFLPDLMHH